MLGTRRPVERYRFIWANESEAQGITRREQDVTMGRKNGQIENHARTFLVCHLRAIGGSQETKSRIKWREVLGFGSKVPELRTANANDASKILDGPLDREASVIVETLGLVERVARNGESRLKVPFLPETWRHDTRPPIAVEMSPRLGISGCRENAAAGPESTG